MRTAAAAAAAARESILSVSTRLRLRYAQGDDKGSSVSLPLRLVVLAHLVAVQHIGGVIELVLLIGGQRRRKARILPR